MLISKKPERIEKDLEDKTRNIFVLKAELDHPDNKKSESYLILYKDKFEDIIILKEAKSSEDLEGYIKNLVKKYNSQIETKRGTQIPRFMTKAGIIYSFAKQVKK
jgi:hypothetical protein